MTEFKPKEAPTLVAGVMGWPISHSKSPRIHGHWLKQFNIKGNYIPLAVRPEQLEMALCALPALGFRGVNLTLPHKEAAIKIVEHIDDLAKRVGAINTIVVKEGGVLFGTNTDVFGFSENLVQAGFAVDASNPVATVLGAGGAARAIIVALQDMGVQKIYLINRDKAKAEKLAADLVGRSLINVFGWEDVPRALSESSLFVNSTSLGMVGQPALEIDLSALKKGAWVTDAVYAPLETALLTQAKRKGLRVVDGLGMLLHQARPGFAAWFGPDPSVTPSLREIILAEP